MDSFLLGSHMPLLQLKFLHVSDDSRGQRLDQHLFNLAAREAMQCGVKGLYISATPTENTINFYLKSGCQLTLEPDKVLLALEPEDIHLEYIFDSENNS